MDTSRNGTGKPPGEGTGLGPLGGQTNDRKKPCEMKLRKPIESGNILYHFFENAQGCLNYFEHTPRHPGAEVLFTDINMPEVSGFDLLGVFY